MILPNEEGNPEINTKNLSFKILEYGTEDTYIANAVVTLSDGNNTYTGRTGGAGGCTVSDVPYGEYDLSIVAEGYREYKQITTNGDDPIIVDETIDDSVMEFVLIKE